MHVLKRKKILFIKFSEYSLLDKFGLENSSQMTPRSPRGSKNAERLRNHLVIQNNPMEKWLDLSKEEESKAEVIVLSSSSYDERHRPESVLSS
jgi:hypothetical protein